DPPLQPFIPQTLLPSIIAQNTFTQNGVGIRIEPTDDAVIDGLRISRNTFSGNAPQDANADGIVDAGLDVNGDGAVDQGFEGDGVQLRRSGDADITSSVAGIRGILIDTNTFTGNAGDAIDLATVNGG